MGVTSNGRAWVLSRAEWGPADDGREAPEVVAVAAIVNPGTTNEDRVVQQLLDAAADWFRLDEIAKEGLFDVDYPGFE